MQKTLLITGGFGGLGKSVVKKFLSLGYHILATTEPGSEIKTEENLEAYPVDITNESECGKLVEYAAKKYAKIDAAILLVGGFAMGSISETDGNALEKMFKLNFQSAYFTVRPLLDKMLNQENGGKIILIGARPALQPSAGKNMVAYALSKSLIFNLSELINATGKEKNVVSTVIVPSTIDTPANRKSMPDVDFEKWVKPEDLANLMEFVCSDSGTILREPVLKAYNQS